MMLEVRQQPVECDSQHTAAVMSTPAWWLPVIATYDILCCSIMLQAAE